MLMMQNRNPDLRAYFVWGPFLKNDTEALARASTERFAAPNSVYFWTPTPKLALDLSSALRMPAGRLAWDVYLLYKKGITWDKTIPEPTYWQHQLDILQGEPLQIDVMEQHAQALLK